MAKFQSKDKPKGGSSKGISKPSKKRNKILQKKAKYSSKKFKGQKQLKEKKIEMNDETLKLEEPKANQLKRKSMPTEYSDESKGNDSKIDIKKGKAEHRDQSVKDLMTIYEKLRRKSTSKEDRYRLIEEVLQYSYDKKEQIVFKHDTVRVLEHCVKYGDLKQREKLFDLFKDNTIQLVTTEGYSKFLVKKFMEYGTKGQKAKIIASFSGKTRNLMKQKVAADILEDIYCRHANAIQRHSLTEEFYGPDYAVYKIATGQSFDHMIENEPEKKKTVMDFMKTQFMALCQKGLITHSITHKALLDFFKYASVEQKYEVYEALKEQVVNILHTKEGARVSMNCLWIAPKKDRKAILKSFKTYIMKICKEEFGHLVMLALFDVFDDTVFVKKALFPEIVSNLEDLIANQYGRKVILYLLKPRSPSYFLPDIVKILEQGDGNQFSKKAPCVRQDELRACILLDLLKSMVSHLDDILRNKSVAIVLLAALECAPDCDELTDIFEKVAAMLSEPIVKIDNEEQKENDMGESPTSNSKLKEHLVCDACGHWVIKNLIQQDKKRMEKHFSTMFSTMLSNSISASSIAEWATFNRGAFILISLIESGIDAVKDMVIKNLNLPAKVKDDDGQGVKLLHKLVT